MSSDITKKKLDELRERFPTPPKGLSLPSTDSLLEKQIEKLLDEILEDWENAIKQRKEILKNNPNSNVERISERIEILRYISQRLGIILRSR